MPNIGDIKHKHKNSRGIFQWLACIDCGKERWSSIRKGNPTRLRCARCSNSYKSVTKKGPDNPRWKGGRQLASGGYIRVWLSDDDFFHSMTDKRNLVMEHRLVMAKHLKRNLHKWELVHHKGIKYPLGSTENKQDNRIENLMVIVSSHNNTGAHTAKMACPYCQREFRVR